MHDLLVSPFLSEDGCNILLPKGKMAAAYRKVLRGYAMTVRAYLDGSGKQEDPNSKILTLAGIAAQLPSWEALESEWARICWKHHVCGSHLKDAMHFHGDFEGWNTPRVERFFADLEEALVTFGNLPKTYFSVVSVDLQAYRHVVEKKSTVLIAGQSQPYPDAATLCAFGCLNFLCWRKDAGALEMFFDRGEPFYNEIYQIWNNPKRAKLDPRMSRVSRMSIGTQDFDLPLQATDYFAWHINRFWTKGDNAPYGRLSQLMGGASHAWNIENLVDDKRIELALSGTYAV